MSDEPHGFDEHGLVDDYFSGAPELAEQPEQYDEAPEEPYDQYDDEPVYDEDVQHYYDDSLEGQLTPISPWARAEAEAAETFRQADARAAELDSQRAAAEETERMVDATAQRHGLNSLENKRAIAAYGEQLLRQHAESLRAQGHGMEEITRYMLDNGDALVELAFEEAAKLAERDAITDFALGKLGRPGRR